MRRLSFIALILLVGGTTAPQRALAQAGTPTQAAAPAQAGTPPQAAALAQRGPGPGCAAPDPADASRSLFELTDRELFIGGRFTSIDGDPARFQRYQDVRDGLLFTGFRYCSRRPTAPTPSARARTMSDGAIRSTSPTTTAPGSCRSPGATSRSRSSTASTR